MRVTTRLVALALAAVLMAGCATSIPPGAGSNPSDPWEVYNRHMFEFNERADAYVIKPVAEGYAKAVPELVRDCIGNIFRNVGDLGNALNNLLQGKPYDASSDVCRVVINSTVGVLGCFDVATKVGLARSNEDFGQTLGKYGLNPGPYFVLPILGPSTVRDSIGRAADIYTDPVSYISYDAYEIAAQTLRAVDLRASLLQASRLLEGAALDKYQFVRDGYLQRRRNLIYDGNPPREKEPDQEYEDPEKPDAAPPGKAEDKPAVEGEQARPPVQPPAGPGR